MTAQTKLIMVPLCKSFDDDYNVIYGETDGDRPTKMK